MTSDPHQAYAPQPPKRGMSTGKKVGLGCGISTLIFIAFAGGCMAMIGGAANEVDKAVKADASEDARAAKQDVKITTCKLKNDDILGRSVEARVEITNHGKKRANYLVEGEFIDANGNQVDTLTATVQNLAPGTSTSQDFVGLITPDDLKDVTKGTCKVLKVTRDEWSAAN